MAPRSPLILAILCCLLSQLGVQALQVTPNSPCASICIDSTTDPVPLDPSDPNSSNTRNSDIVCEDAKYAKTPAGTKWQNCMSCLQNSTFAQGSENDQMWFIYNMRYSLSYCIFGYPNASDAKTSPCTTSFACEPLTSPLEDKILTPQSLTQYGYCSVNNGAMTHQNINRCSSCIAAGGDTQYLANYLTALDAGCQQQPIVGHTLGLNGSVFTPTAISVVDPALLLPTAVPSSGSKGISPTIIAVIIVVVIVVLLIVSAFVFIHIKKRQNRRKRASYADKYKPWGNGKNNSHPQMPQSPLSFQCQTRMDPASPKFFHDDDGDENEMGYAPNNSSNLPGRKSSHWKPHNAMSSFQNISAVTEYPGKDMPQQKPSRKNSSRSTRSNHQNPLQYHPSNHPVPLHSINTTTLPSYPTHTHASPMSGSVARFSPDSYTTPTSAVSVRSTAPLLPYVPAEHGTLRGPAVNSPQSATTTASASPLLRSVATFGGGAQRESTASTLPPAPPPKSPRMIPSERNLEHQGLRFKGVGKMKERESGSPVETRRMGNTFPPPPPRR